MLVLPCGDCQTPEETEVPLVLGSTWFNLVVSCKLLGSRTEKVVREGHARL